MNVCHPSRRRGNLAWHVEKLPWERRREGDWQATFARKAGMSEEAHSTEIWVIFTTQTDTWRSLLKSIDGDTESTIENSVLPSLSQAEVPPLPLSQSTLMSEEDSSGAHHVNGCQGVGRRRRRRRKGQRDTHTEGEIKVCTWLREISSCYCLTVLPGAWPCLGPA